ncbi:hypothetical protein BDN72DRAFT_843644 [Pluteus cervinus]|uniref:Uncharacterized protein n=1 Tax=Pluteus cervinus TaxID=181527 RepID=A0ACD3ANX7_9AGAR|nr:hypothetical protein BDN72DRAFT_843644 [Pluteus cervinus]
MTPGISITPLAGMNDLPRELVLEIIRLDAYRNILTIAQLSRYLNSIATSSYFHQGPDPHHLNSVTLHFNGIDTTMPSNSGCTARNPKAIPAASEQSFDILTMLSIAFNIQTLGKLVWVFTGSRSGNIKPGQPIPTWQFTTHINRLTMFLRRLIRIDKIHLIFKVDIGVPPEWPHASGLLQLDRWTVAMVDLLNACMEKLKTNPKSVEEFQMEGPILMIQRSYQIHDDLRRRLGAFVGFFKSTTEAKRNPTLDGRTWCISRPGRLPLSEVERNISLSPDARSVLGSIQKLKISFEALLHPPLCEWTYQVISFAPLTSLILENINFYPYNCDILFSWLCPALQHLEDLTIRRCHFEKPQWVAKLLESLPRLKHCHLDTHLSYYKIRPQQIVSCNLPNLSTFTAPVEFIHLIRPKGFQVFVDRVLKKPNSLKKLRVVVSRDGDGFKHLRDAGRDYVKGILQAYLDVPWIILDTEAVSQHYYNCVFAFPGSAQGLGKDKRVSVSLARVVKELVMSEKTIRSFVRWHMEGFLDFLGVLNGLKVVSVVAPITMTSAIDGREWMKGREWVNSGVFDLLKSACQSLERIGLQLEGAGRRIVIHVHEF